MKRLSSSLTLALSLLTACSTESVPSPDVGDISTDLGAEDAAKATDSASDSGPTCPNDQLLLANGACATCPYPVDDVCDLVAEDSFQYRDGLVSLGLVDARAKVIVANFQFVSEVGGAERRRGAQVEGVEADGLFAFDVGDEVGDADYLGITHLTVTDHCDDSVAMVLNWNWMPDGSGLSQSCLTGPPK